MADSQSALTSSTQAVVNSLSDMWAQFISFVPNLIAAVIVLFIGWAIAVAVGRLVEKVLVILHVNTAFDSLTGFKNAVEQGGIKLNMARFVGEVFKWFLIIVTLLATTDILGLQEVSQFLTQVLLYIPNVVVAVIIMVIAVVLANFVYKTVLASVNAAGFTSAGAVAALSKWAIVIFALFAALLQLNVATPLIQTFLTAFFAMLALAGGLAFGLGGKELAAKWLNKFEQDLTGRSR